MPEYELEEICGSVNVINERLKERAAENWLVVSSNFVRAGRDWRSYDYYTILVLWCRYPTQINYTVKLGENVTKEQIQEAFENVYD